MMIQDEMLKHQSINEQIELLKEGECKDALLWHSVIERW